MLFLDKSPEFARRLEAIRSPLEDKIVTIRRVQGMLTFPANVMPVAAMDTRPRGLTEIRRGNVPVCRFTHLLR